MQAGLEAAESSLMGLWLVLVVSSELQSLLELTARTPTLRPVGSGLPYDVEVKVIG